MSTRASRIRLKQFAAAIGIMSVVAVGCSSDSDDAGSKNSGSEKPETTLELSDANATKVAETYTELVLANYDAVVDSAETLDAAIEAFTAAPTDETLEAARTAWLEGRELYGPTEVFRFYDGPIDDPESGPEGQINAWPLDESYIDYVDGDEEAGIINDAEGVPEITTDVLVDANENGGETNISTGWHAIEFLLWGQDESVDGPGDRPVTDYTDAPNAERRGTYLGLLSDLLVSDLESVRDQWTEGADYRTSFMEEPQVAVSDMLRGMGALSSGELAGERMAVPYETKDQEDEHSCFSDNTLTDVVGNATGIRMAYTADFPGVDGTSLSDVVSELDPEMDKALMTSLDENVDRAEALTGPFDQLIQGDEDGRAEMLTLIEGLQAQGDQIADVAAALGFEISIEV